MNVHYRFVLLMSILLGLVSCSETKMLTKGLISYPQSLGYTLITPIDSSAKNDSVIVSFSGYQMDSLTSVHREKGLVLPFIFLNITEFKYRFKLGANLLNEDYNDFFFNALLDESERSGAFTVCYDSTRLRDVYHLEVSLDTCTTDTHFMENSLTIFYVYGYFTTYSESSYPARSTVACRLKLSKGDRVLKDTTVSDVSMRVFQDVENVSRSERMSRTAECMASTLCESTRDCITKMVREVNGTLAQKR